MKGTGPRDDVREPARSVCQMSLKSEKMYRSDGWHNLFNVQAFPLMF